MSDSGIYKSLLSHNPDFMLMTGDLFYSDVESKDSKTFEFAYHEQMKSPQIRSFYTHVPVVYTFDDHDFGENNAIGSAASNLTVNKVYRVRTRHQSIIRI